MKYTYAAEIPGKFYISSDVRTDVRAREDRAGQQDRNKN
jgi:hypothetical protein